MNTNDRSTRIRELLSTAKNSLNYGQKTHPQSAVENMKDIIKLISNEQNKQLQFQYFGELMKVVSDFMGNFIFETLPHDIYYDERKRKKEKQKPEVRVMLRMLKRLHFNLDYKPSQVHNINHWVRQCGGTILTQDDLRKQKREKFLKQRQDLESGAEMPRSEKRKLKKKIRMVEKIAVTRKAKAENRKKQYELHKARAMVQSQIEADSGKKKLGLFGLFGRVFSDSK